MVLYAINFILILYPVFRLKGYQGGIGSFLSITFSIFIVNFYTHENLRKGTVRPVHVSIETFLSWCRAIVNFGSGIYIALPLALISPVNFVIWIPLVELTNENVLPGYVFHIICFLLFLFELCYLSEIKELEKRTSGKLNEAEQQ